MLVAKYGYVFVVYISSSRTLGINNFSKWKFTVQQENATKFGSKNDILLIFLYHKATSYGYILVDLCIISFNLNCVMQLKQFYNIATKVTNRKKCYFSWWSTWLLTCRAVSNITSLVYSIVDPAEFENSYKLIWI